MPRFHKVRGVFRDGQPALVSDPRALYASPPRFIGMKPVPLAEGLDPAADKRKPAQRFEAIEQVVPDADGVGTHVIRAAKDGDLVLLGTCTAPSLAEATFPLVQIQRATKAAPTAKDS